MATRKHRKSRKTTKRFRRTRSKRQRGGTITNDKLIKASKDGDIVAVRNLIDEEGADVTASDSDGRTALIWASRNGHTGIVTTLLEYVEEGTDVNAKDDHGDTSLHFASENRDTGTVAILLDAGADVNAKDDHGDTSLHFASYYGHTEIVAMLLENGADVNAIDDNGWTALHKAVNQEEEHLGTVKLLIDRGNLSIAEVNAENDNGSSAYEMALHHDHRDIIDFLEEVYWTILPRPPCMTQSDFDTCEKDKDEEPDCKIGLNEITKETAVRTHPPQSTNDKVPCYDRENLRKWLGSMKEKKNPYTNEPITHEWIEANMGNKKCEPQTESAPETVFNSPPTGGKRKTKKSKRKSKKSNRKNRKTRKK